jgi:hypothetical protein
MAQADSVPSAIRAPITAATSKASTNGRSADPRCFAEEASTGRLPKGSDITAVSYATAVVLVAGFPWNILLILFLCRNNRLGSIGLDTVSSARCRMFWAGGRSL